MSADHDFVKVENASCWFDVSAPWLERVVKRRPRVQLKAVNGVSFSLRKGETLALVGESGCGKSTVARLLVGLYTPTSGHIEFDGEPISKLHTREGKSLRQRLQMIFQDPYASLNPRWRVARIIAEPLRVHGQMSAAERDARVDELLEQVGLSATDRNRYPHQFSGGQRQRISIARALAARPEFLVCDEPTSALDVSVQAQVLNLMMDLQEEFDLAYLFISHDLSVVRHIANEVMVMYLGRPVEHGPKETIFARPRHPYTRVLLASTPSVDPAARSRRIAVRGELPSPLDPPPGCPFHRRCPFATEECAAVRPELRPVDGRLVACHYAETVS